MPSHECHEMLWNMHQNVLVGMSWHRLALRIWFTVSLPIREKQNVPEYLRWSCTLYTWGSNKKSGRNELQCDVCNLCNMRLSFKWFLDVGCFDVLLPGSRSGRVVGSAWQRSEKQHPKPPQTWRPWNLRTMVWALVALVALALLVAACWKLWGQEEAEDEAAWWLDSARLDGLTAGCWFHEPLNHLRRKNRRRLWMPKQRTCQTHGQLKRRLHCARMMGSKKRKLPRWFGGALYAKTNWRGSISAPSIQNPGRASMLWKMVSSWMWSSLVSHLLDKKHIKHLKTNGTRIWTASRMIHPPIFSVMLFPYFFSWSWFSILSLMVPRPGTYDMLHRAQVEWPCLSVDVIRDDLGAQRHGLRDPITSRNGHVESVNYCCICSRQSHICSGLANETAGSWSDRLHFSDDGICCGRITGFPDRGVANETLWISLGSLGKALHLVSKWKSWRTIGFTSWNGAVLNAT